MSNPRNPGKENTSAIDSDIEEMELSSDVIDSKHKKSFPTRMVLPAQVKIIQLGQVS